MGLPTYYAHCYLIEDNSDDVLGSHPDRRPINTIQLDFQEPACLKDYDQDSDTENDITSYHLTKAQKE